MIDLSKLNEQQRNAVLHTDGAVLVTAGAGSGKTRVLTYRIAHLVLDKMVSPFNILAITFTNKATDEMRQRLEAMTGESANLWISTFHSMCVSILRHGIERLGYKKSFSIYGDAEKKRIIDEIVKGIGCDDEMAKRAVGAISEAKNFNLSPSEYESRYASYGDAGEVAKIYFEYENKLRANNALDFDDLLIKTLVLLQQDAETREFYQNKFRYIHVDEFQDTNLVQYLLIKILGAKHRNVFCVGDEDQTIYSWRGANVSNILSFCRDFNSTIYKLEQNYRSTKKILECANLLIKNNSGRLDKTLWTNNSDGTRVEYYKAGNENDEVNYIVDNMLTLIRSHGYKYSDFAVLMRVNALSRLFEEKLLFYNIPHKIFGGQKFFERKEIKDILAYMKAVNNPQDEEAVLRIINFPRRGIGDVAKAQLVNYAFSAETTLFELIRDNQLLPSSLAKKVESLSKIFKRLSLLADQPIDILTKELLSMLGLEVVFGSGSEEDKSRLFNIGEFVNMVAQRCEGKNSQNLSEFLDSVSLYTDIDELDTQNNSVKIATVHSAKGLEFRVVFVVGAEEGIFPLSRSVYSLSEMEEERRLMYVAMTRARERLFVTSAASRFMYGTRKYSVPSKFLLECGLISPRVTDSVEPLHSASAKSTAQSFSFRSNVAKPEIKNTDFSAFVAGVSVVHPRFGRGVILSVSRESKNTYAEVRFDSHGVLNLVLNYAPIKLAEQD